jgi:hypothetical protein
MNEKKLGTVLLHGEGAIDSQVLTDRILRRDRRRIWMLGIVCVLAWMMVVMLPWATILPMLAKVVEHQVEMNGRVSMTTPEQQEQSMRVLQIVKRGTIATFLGSVGSMFVAALCTVGLIILSRRTTLRQVNARLAEISAQLKASTGGSK